MEHSASAIETAQNISHLLASAIETVQHVPHFLASVKVTVKHIPHLLAHTSANETVQQVPHPLHHPQRLCGNCVSPPRTQDSCLDGSPAGTRGYSHGTGHMAGRTAHRARAPPKGHPHQSSESSPQQQAQDHWTRPSGTASHTCAARTAGAFRTLHRSCTAVARRVGEGATRVKLKGLGKL